MKREELNKIMDEVNKMKKFLVLSRCSPEYNIIVGAEDISEVADHYYDSCYGIIEISQDQEHNSRSRMYLNFCSQKR